MDFKLRLLKDTYTGQDIKIGLIDTGALDCKIANHYIVLNGEVREIGPNDLMEYIKDLHGTACAKQIIKTAPNSKVYDINVQPQNSDVRLDDVLVALEFCINNKFDIISISLGIYNGSKQLRNLCQSAYNSGIIVVGALSKSDKPIYPASYKYVIGVNCVIDVTEESINYIRFGNYAVSCDPIILSDANGNESMYYGSSICTAFMTSVIALYIESCPLKDKSEILNDIYDSQHHLPSQAIRTNNQFVLSPDSKCLYFEDTFDIFNSKYSKLLNSNITEICNVSLLLKEGEDIISKNLDDNIYILNPCGFERNKIPFLNIEDKKYIGKFVNNLFTNSNKKMFLIQTPTILICGVGQNCGKFKVHLDILHEFYKDNLKTHNITFNPAGYIYDMEVLEYPNHSNTMDLPYKFNHLLRDIEDEYRLLSYNKNDYLDAIIINVAGGISYLENNYDNDFGILFHSIANSHNVDHVIFITNTSISVDYTLKLAEYIENLTSAEPIIVISNNSYNFDKGIENNEYNSYKDNEMDIYNYKAFLNENSKYFIFDFYDEEYSKKITNLMLE